jgi:hypothetical protein
MVSTPKRNPAEHSEARGPTCSRESILGKTVLIRDIQPIFHTKIPSDRFVSGSLSLTESQIYVSFAKKPL